MVMEGVGGLSAIASLVIGWVGRGVSVCAGSCWVWGCVNINDTSQTTAGVS